MKITNNHGISFVLKQLKNGSRYPEREVKQAIDSIETVKAGNPADFFELVKLSRFPGYKLTDACLLRLTQAGVVYRGELKEPVRDVILSSVRGRTADQLEVTNPYETASQWLASLTI